MAGEVELKCKGQALRLDIQQELGSRPLTIFRAAAKKHDLSIGVVTAGIPSNWQRSSRTSSSSCAPLKWLRWSRLHGQFGG